MLLQFTKKQLRRDSIFLKSKALLWLIKLLTIDLDLLLWLDSELTPIILLDEDDKILMKVREDFGLTYTLIFRYICVFQIQHFY